LGLRGGRIADILIIQRLKEGWMLRLALAFAITSLAVSPAYAAPCKDAKGKFTKCPTAPAKTVRCKAANGKFAKCGTPGAKPI
jgi:hypothetical protein